MKGFIEVIDATGDSFLINISQLVYAGRTSNGCTVVYLTTGKVFTISMCYPEFVQLVNSSI